MWLLVIGVHIFVLHFFYDFSFGIAIFDSLLFNGIFYFLGIMMWYVINFSSPEKSKVINTTFNHITLLIVIQLIWIGIGYNILRYVYDDNLYYSFFLSESLTWRVISGVLFYTIIALFYYIIIYYRNLQEKITAEVKLRETIKEAELSLLKSQINPHFLFNSLNSISSLTITNPEKAQEMIIKLSDFLRYVVSKNENNLIPFEQELENSKRYLEIEQIRFGAKLQFNFEMENDCSIAKIPTLLLQPLYENAVKHGVYESTEPIIIKTTCKLKEKYMELVIENNFENEMSSKKGAGIGLRNIKNRLELTYNATNLIKIEKTENIFTVKLTIPFEI